MAEQTKKPRSRSSTGTKSKTKAASVESEVASAIDAEIKTSASSHPKRMATNALPLDTKICCVSGVANGQLVYVSNLYNGRETVWTEFGVEQFLEFQDLQAMRAQYPKFFSENWLLIDDQEALEALGATQYYHGVYSAEDVYDIFTYAPAKIRKIVSEVGNGLKESIASIAHEKYESGELDSNAKIKAIEETTGFTITE